jgi:hypothetical protein
VSGNRFLYKNALKLTYEHLENEKIFRGLRLLDLQGGEGRGGEGYPPRQNPAYATDYAYIKNVAKTHA